MDAIEIRRRRVHLVLLVAGAAVVAALAALPWHTYAISVEGAGSFRFERTGLQSPEEAMGRVAVAAASALVVIVGWVVARIRTDPGVAARSLQLVTLLAVAVPVLLGAKILLNRKFLGVGAWISLALGIVVAVAGLNLHRRPR